MAAVLELGPSDHGRPLSFAEFLSADYRGGYKYELIDGRLYVSPEPNQPHDWDEQYIFLELLGYSHRHPDVINRVANKARVFVPSAKRTTCPEPDIAAYHEFPRHQGPHVQWQDVSPILVVEILGGGDVDKDLHRNTELYLQVPSIQEYWILDIRDDPARPSLLAHRRDRDDCWSVHRLPYGETYRTPLLPELELSIDPN